MSAIAFKILLYTAGVCLILFGLFGAPPSAQQVAQRQHAAAEHWAPKAIAELEPDTGNLAKYEACARGIREDYSDDPERADRWIRTLCHR